MAGIVESRKSPLGWETRTLGELCDVITDGTHFTPTYVERGIPFFSVESVTNDDFVNVKYISPAEHRKLTKRCRPQRGDILMTRIGSLGDTKLIDWDVDASIYVSLALLRPGRQIDGRFLYAYTKARAFVQAVEDRSLLWAVPKKINMGDIGSVPVMFPVDRSEQVAVADAILDAEALETHLERLIAKKQAIKQGMMQQLLTGKTRLSGFRVPWNHCYISELLRPRSERNMSAESLTVLSCTKHLGFVRSLDYFKNQVFSRDLTGYRVIYRGDIGYPANHIEEGSIGVQELEDRALVSPIYVVMEPNLGVDSYFLQRMLKLDAYRQKFSQATNASVDRRGSLRWPEFSRIEVSVPGIQEQRAIARALRDSELEVATLERRLRVARDLKQGMMQQLLTGRTRLHVEDAS